VQVASLKRPLPVAAPAPAAITLPTTATDAELSMMLGAILLVLSLMWFVVNRHHALAR
jgi:Ca-activated chloride channel family protein